MREHKYRAWIPELNDWADDIEVYHDGSFNLGKEKPEGLVSGYDGILMQYTGFKDKNGKDIFEGDIVQRANDNNDRNIVSYKGGMFGFETCVFNGDYPDTTEFTSLAGWLDHDLRVIGNIYENPELAAKD